MALLVVAMLGLCFGDALAQEQRLGDSFRVSENDTTARRFSSVAYLGAHDAYLVVWGIINLGARFVSADGAPLTSAIRLNTNGDATQAGAAGVVCADRLNLCLVAWVEENPSSVIKGQFVRWQEGSAGSVELVDVPFAISRTAGWKHTEADPGVAYSPIAREFLVTWTDVGQATGTLDVRAQCVTEAGVLAGDTISIASTGAWEGMSGVAYNSIDDEYMVVYYFEPGNLSAAGVQRVKPGTGALIGTRNTVISSAFDQYPEIAYNSLTNQYLVITWGYAGGWILHGRLVAANGDTVGASVLSLAAGGGGDGIGLAYNPISNSYLASFLSVTHTAAEGGNDIWGAGVSAVGMPGSQFRVTVSGTRLANQPRVGSSALVPRFLVTANNAYMSIMGQMVLASGTGTPCTVNATPTASATAAPGDAVPFTVSATQTGCGSATPTFSWDFGDGSAQSTAQNPTHTYATAGTYPWTLTVQAGTATAVKTGTIEIRVPGACIPSIATVAAKPPTSLAAMWQGTGVSVTAGQAVTITAGGGQTWTNGGRAWTAAGNSADVTSGANSPKPGAPRMALVGRIGTSGAPFLVGTSVQFTAAASGQLYLAPNDEWYLLWDNAGNLTASVCTGGTTSCTVTGTATVPTTAAPGDGVPFKATAAPSGCSSATPTFSWDFGDGSAPSTAQNPTHTYASAGTYTWTLTVQAGTASATRTGTIAVNTLPSCTATTHVVTAKPPTSLAAMWQGTGVSVTTGQAVTITAGGGQTWTNGGQAWTAAGNSADVTSGANSPMPGAPRMALVGRIGTSGAPFLVGTSVQFTAAASGQLYLAPNDEWYLLWNNAGSLTASVCTGGTTSCGGTTTAQVVVARPPTSLAAMWQGTGVSVTAGQVVTITAGGGQTWTNGGQAWTAAGNSADVTSWANSPKPGAPRMALVGRIGTSGAPFLVGTSVRFTAAASGQLYLAPNDDWYLLWDNAGSLTVSVCK